MAAAHLLGKPVHYEHKSGCSGKVAFLSRSDSMKASRKHAAHRDPYLCQHCRLWHNTSRRRLPHDQ